MTDMMKEAHSSKKKFLVPLVVLMMCAVALTGAAYAYNSIVTVDNNTITNDAIYLNLMKTDSNGDATANAAVEGYYSFSVNWTSTTVNGTTAWTKVGNTSVVIPLTIQTNVKNTSLDENIIVTFTGVAGADGSGILATNFDKLAHTITTSVATTIAAVNDNVITIDADKLTYTQGSDGIYSCTVLLTLTLDNDGTAGSPLASASAAAFKVEAKYNSAEA